MAREPMAAEMAELCECGHPRSEHACPTRRGCCYECLAKSENCRLPYCSRFRRWTLAEGTRVQWAYLGQVGDTGTVLRVTPTPHGSGGTRARVRVRWDRNGHEGSVEDRVLRPAPAR